MCKLCSPVRATEPFIYVPSRHTPSKHVYLDGLPLRRLFHRGHEGPCTPPPNPIRLSIGRLLCPAPPPQATEPFPCLPGGWMPPVHAHPTAVPLRRPFHRGREGPGNPRPYLSHCAPRWAPLSRYSTGSNVSAWTVIQGPTRGRPCQPVMQYLPVIIGTCDCQSR